MSGEREQAESAEELVALARRIRAWQEAQGVKADGALKVSDSEMLRRFPDLGSSKTYKNMIAGNLSGYDAAGQHSNYLRVWTTIESFDGAETPAEDLYEDLTPVLALKRSLLETFRESGLARVTVVQGEPGSGKTTTAQIVARKYGQRVVLVEASDMWSDSPMALLGAILKALGVKEPPDSRARRLDLAIELLRQTRRCLVIDEAHHLGPHTLNTIKTLVNQTPGEFVLLALPSLWARMERSAYQEVRQLTTNRLAERIRLDGATKADVTRILKRRVPGLDGAIDQAVKILLQHTGRHGNLAFVRDSCRRAAAMSDGGELGIEDFAACVAAEIESR